ncbi:chromosome segregation protein SMC [Rothia nasimurium]|uniref:chromosome segregation protein SMC n=1 Tax=Rothia nasimurium TaxID=85336 RepID=UPI001F008D3C|nr:chromosome segregation protein SMC [Rothia nasimurium]
MYLKSLTVRGFKSFASATVFEFEPGLNVLVGPNGSGKSNVVDALAWVMGAQGAKQLRGGAMKDVIFAGGGSRGALGRAKVELVIDNEDGALPLPHAEIRLSRTMFSAGGSEYEINGEPARLADVQDLLADAGVGRELYTLVGQGQVDKILHGTADDRRELIEQAAGLLKHRKRQAKTASKLDDLKTNLDRLEDLAGELAEQLEGRREQADAARAASEVAGRVRSLTADLLAHDARAMMQEREAEQAAGQQAEAARLRAQERSRTIEGQLGELAEARQVAQQALDEVTQRRTSLKEVAHLVETVQLVAAERLSASHHREEDQDAATRLVSAQQACAREEENLERAREAGKAAEEELTAAHSALEKARAEQSAAQQALATADQQVRDYKENLSQLTAQLATARVAFERAGEETARRVAEYAEAKEQGASAGADTERAQAAVNGYREQLERAEAEEENLRRARQQANEKVESSRKELHQAQVKLHAAQARCEALEAAWQHDDAESGDSEGLRQQALEQGAQELISLLEIEDTWQAAVAAALGPYLRALTLTSGESLPAGVTQLYSFEGDIEQIDLHELSTSQAEVYQARPLADVLTAPQALSRALAVLTADIYLAPDEEAARALVAAHPGVRAVTPDGTVLTAGSTLYPSQERPLTERYAELTRAQQTHRELAQQQEQAERAHQQAEEVLKTAQEAEKAQARTTGSLTAQLTAARADLATLTGRAESSQAALDRLQEAATRAEEAQKKTQRHVEAAQEALARARSTEPQADSATLREAVRTAEKTLVEAQEAKTLAEATATYAREKEEAAQARLAQAQEALAALEKAEEARQLRQQEAADARHQARKVAARGQALALAIERVQALEDKAHQKALKKVQEASKALNATREELAGSQTSLAAALTLQAEAAAQGARVEARWEALARRVEKDLGLSLDTLLETREVSDLPRESLEAHLVAAEAELARFGAINPLALEEHEALEQRHSYLRQQIKDIKASRADLRAVMKDVTGHIESSFTRALADVQVEFSRIFALLFPGGQAELVLADPNDLEHSGLDIRVKPAGKKVTRLSLLSGGERTLASLALLLAVFMARPAPFYVLDEVEAALDDRNLGRLLEVLAQLREKSQLLMITHHQRTMAQADTLYGISMRQGVSTVLSHRLED